MSREQDGIRSEVGPFISGVTSTSEVTGPKNNDQGHRPQPGCAFVWEEIALQCWETQLPGTPGLSPGTVFHVALQRTIVWSTVTSEAQSLAVYLWMQWALKTGSGWGSPIRALFSSHSACVSILWENKYKYSNNLCTGRRPVAFVLLRAKTRAPQRSFSQTSRILWAFVTELDYQVVFCDLLHEEGENLADEFSVDVSKHITLNMRINNIIRLWNTLVSYFQGNLNRLKWPLS